MYIRCSLGRRFYYVNTAPMWKRNIEQWTHVEEAIRGTVKSTDHKFAIISGTFGSDMLPDVNNTQQPLFLSKTKQVPVPSIFWKLLFDINLMTVKVYLVSNDPNMNPERLSYICENRCQEERDYLNEIAPELFPNKLYCCDIHSFQKVYGILEPLIIIENVMNRLANEERSFENYSSEESDWTDEIEQYSTEMK